MDHMPMITIAGLYHFAKQDLIGAGAFAIVYKGSLIKNPKEKVAVKCVLRKNIVKNQTILSKEIKILEELTELQHPNLVALHYVNHTATEVQLVMEYCNGGDLAEYLSKHEGKLNEVTIRAFTKQLGKAMMALVGKGIVHRDLKPQNILLSHQSTKEEPAPDEIILKMADFGFARFLPKDHMAVTLCGSPMYMAPEVIMSHKYDATADLWSLGTILYQCLTGGAPFSAQTPQQLKSFYEANKDLCPRLPKGTSKELGSLLVGLLKRKPEDRMSHETFFTHPLIRGTSPQPIPNRLFKPRPHRPSLSTPPDPGYGRPNPYSCSPVAASPISLRNDRFNPPLGSPKIRPNINVGVTPTHNAHIDTTSVEDGFVMVSAAQQTDYKGLPLYTPSASPKTHPSSGTLRIQPIGLIAQTNPETELLRASVGQYMQIDGIPVPNQLEAFKQITSTHPSPPAHQPQPISTPQPKVKPEYTVPNTCPIDPPEVQYQPSSPAVHRRASLINSNLPQNVTENQTSAQDNSIFLLQRSKTDPVLNQVNANPDHVIGRRMFGSPDYCGSPVLHDHYVEDEHKRILAKLMFVRRFVDCIMQVAEAKSDWPIRFFDLDSLPVSQNHPSRNRPQRNNKTKSLTDQLSLHLKAMEVLGSAMGMATDEMKSKTLQPTKPVLDVLKYLKQIWDHCCVVSKHIQSIDFQPCDYPLVEDETADELLYEYALRLCQTASADEVCGSVNLEEAARRYEVAQVLLHCLAAEAVHERDRSLLTKYKKSVEKRLHLLSRRGVVQAVPPTQ